MKISFEGEDLQHVVASIGDFLNELTSHPTLSEGADPPPPNEKPEPTKRRRRARSTEAADEDTSAPTAGGRKRRRTSTASDEGGQEKPEPTPRRRRARSTETSAQDAPAKGRTRRRASAKSPSDELKDTDLSKAASGLADATNPKIVLDLLEEFGVAKVGELEGDARREFVEAATEIAADAA